MFKINIVSKNYPLDILQVSVDAPVLGVLQWWRFEDHELHRGFTDAILTPLYYIYSKKVFIP